MSISEQVKELRETANRLAIGYNVTISAEVKQFMSAADTIEALSAKLENIEQSEDCGGWILCKDRLPSKEECKGHRGGKFLVTVFASNLTTLYMHNLTTLYMQYEYVTIRGKEVSRWVWNNKVKIPWEVIAWKPLPEPYYEP